MRFSGRQLSVGAMLDAARADDQAATVYATVGVLHTAADNVRHAAALLAAGDSLQGAWRFGVLQTLDDYNSTVRRGGVLLGAQVFDDEPAPSGATELDAAIAALADYLAERDGWTAPAWVPDPSRATTSWFAAVPEIDHADAELESPRAFRQRGILITLRSLARA